MALPSTISFSENTEYKRDLGLIEAVAIVISRIIGSGIFRTPAPIMWCGGQAGGMARLPKCVSVIAATAVKNVMI